MIISDLGSSMTKKYIKETVLSKLEELFALSDNKRISPKIRKAILYIKNNFTELSDFQTIKLFQIFETFKGINLKTLGQIFSVIKNSS